MPLRFSMLASGSGGNACLVRAGGFGVLIDAGIGPRQLADRLSAAGSSWDEISAALLTHTHSDHWKDRSFAQLHRRRIPLYCHPEHVEMLSSCSDAFLALRDEGLVRLFDSGGGFALTDDLHCLPIPVRHDGGPTFGFRFDAAPDLFGLPNALAYVADLGCWNMDLVEALVDVDLLALEFNHDERMERNCGRPAYLIARVLGDRGHLSNEQAADLLHEVLRLSTPGRLRHVVQLHLSRQCNRPALAEQAAQVIIQQHAAAVEVHTAAQDCAGPNLTLSPFAGPATPRNRRPRHNRQTSTAGSPVCRQRYLPGWDEVS